MGAQPGVIEPSPRPAGGRRARTPRRSRSIRRSQVVRTATAALPGSVLIRHLRRIELFHGCTRRDLRQIARFGDVVEVDAGAVLMREDHPDYWLYVVLSGTIRLSSRGEPGPELRRGGCVGHEAIVGFGLQASTVTATEPSLLFVIGRRPLLTLVQTIVPLQRALFPDSATRGFEAVRKELFARGNEEWEAAAALWGPGPIRFETLPPTFRALKLPGRPAARSSLADALAGLLDPRSRTDEGHEPPPRRLSLRARLAVAAGIAAVTLAGSAIYHPPFAIVRLGDPVDVAGDISTAQGGPPLSGPYLLLSVRIEQPTVLRAAATRVTGGSVLTLRSSGEGGDPGRDDFLASERLAVAAAARSAGLDPARVTVEFAERDVRGSSAGLIYALALADLLDAGDLARGRTVAATGAIDDAGNVLPVRFVTMKADVAKAGGATVMLVPAGQERYARGRGLRVVGVKSVSEALAELRKA